MELKESYVDPTVIEITENGKIQQRNLALYIVGGCNLRCDNCGTGSPFQQWITPTYTVMDALDVISSRFVLNEFRISGGEPLLHPDLPVILDKSCRLFPCEVQLYTNAVELKNGRHSRQIIELCNKYPQPRLIIWKHLELPGLEEWLSEHSIPHRINGNGRFARYDIIPETLSDASISYANCIGNFCPCVIENELHRCCRYGMRLMLVKHGVKGKYPLKCEFAYKSCDLTSATNIDIKDYLLDRPFSECSYCAEHNTWVPERQLTPDDTLSICRTLTGNG